MSYLREIASQKRYNKVSSQAIERQHEEVLAAIDQALQVYGPMINCALLHRYLKLRFPYAECWGSVDHVMTEIGGRLYAKSGMVAEKVSLCTEPPHWFKKSFRWPKTNTPNPKITQ